MGDRSPSGGVDPTGSMGDNGPTMDNMTKRTVAPAGFPPLRYDLAERAERESRADGAWSLAHLRLPSIATLALAVIGVPLGLLVQGWSAAWGVLLGLTVVAFFFTLSSWVVARAGELNPSWTMPAALVTYGLKLFILGILLAAFPIEGPIDRIWVGASIAVGLMVWLACQAWVVIRTPRMYVDTSAAAGPTVPAGMSPKGVRPSPADTPRTGGTL